jgi:hypothetical protein
MSIEKLIKEEEEEEEEGMISSFFRGKDVFLFSFWSPPSSFLSFFLFDRKP